MQCFGQAVLAPGERHSTRDGRSFVAAVNDKVVAFGFSRDRLLYCLLEQRIITCGTKRRAEIGAVALAEAHVERTRAGHAHAIAALAEIGRASCRERV